MTDVELVAEHDHRVGEGPLWHPDEACLYWVDIPTGRCFCYDPDRDRSERVFSVDRPLGGVTIQADGSLALFLGAGGVALWDGDRFEYVVDSIPGETDSRFNDVVADPEGRVFAGTMPTVDGLGSLYRVDPDGSYALVDGGYDVPNGMGFTPDDSGLYVTESEAQTIYRFEYDRATGSLSRRTAFVEPPLGAEGTHEASEHGRLGVPDGLAVDETGCVWSARWDGNCVLRHAPDGEVVERIDVPAPKLSAVTFGGPEYEDLYVTTASGHDAEDAPPAGSLFRARPDVGGVPPFRSRIGIA